MVFHVQRFVAFDLEFDRLLPKTWSRESTASERARNACHVRILCGAAHGWDGYRPFRVAWSPAASADCLAPEQVDDIVAYLHGKFKRRFVLVTWGGTATDWRVLAQRSSAPELCKSLARRSVDVPLISAACLGVMMGLKNARLDSSPPAAGAGGSSSKRDSSAVPDLWRSSRADVIRHVAEDARVTAQVYMAIAMHGTGHFTTGRGEHRAWVVPRKLFRGRVMLETVSDVLARPARSCVPRTKEECAAWLL
jgi:hypothetical protein